MVNREPHSHLLDPTRSERYIQAITYIEGTQVRIRSLLIPDVSLAGKVDMLRRMSIVFRRKFGYGEAFFTTLDDESLGRLLSESHVDIARFVELSLLPTPLLLTYLFEGRVAELKSEKDRIKAGGFDKESRLHRELEYSRYRVGSKEFDSNFRNAFGSNPEYRLAHETEIEEEIEAIVSDNRDIQAFIEGEAGKGKVLILWNDRYGSYYVGNFLAEPLKNNPNIRTSTIRVSSTQFDSREKFEQSIGRLFFLPPDIKHYIEQEYPTIIVIDGTNSKGGSKERFPGSMTKIHADFDKTGKYKTRFWIPGKGEVGSRKVSIGSWGYPVPAGEKDDENQGDIILIRANGRSSGLLDDPEEMLAKQVLVFGPRGLTPGKYYDGTLATLLERIGKAMKQ